MEPRVINLLRWTHLEGINDLSCNIYVLVFNYSLGLGFRFKGQGKGYNFMFTIFLVLGFEV